MQQRLTCRAIIISPYIREGSGLKPRQGTTAGSDLAISPYIREGSGLKLVHPSIRFSVLHISPYIREGSGLKLSKFFVGLDADTDLPLHP